MALQFFAGSKEALGLGMAPDNSGVVTVHDKAGQYVADMAAIATGGLLEVDSPSGQVESQVVAHAQGGYLL